MARSIGIVVRDYVNFNNYLSGQEFFVYMLIRKLKSFGFNVEVVLLDELLKGEKRYDVLHLYYLRFRDVMSVRRFFREALLVYHVYHVDDITWSRLHSFSWKCFLASLQFIVDRYLATGTSVYRWLRRRVFLSDCVLVEPYYECSCRSFSSFFRIVEKKFSEIDRLELLYLGRLNPWRFPLRDIVKVFTRLSNKIDLDVRLKVVSKLGISVRKLVVRRGRVTVEFVNERVSEQDKCRLYREAHFFLYPAKGNVAMNPPITLLEAVYHGCLPIVTPYVLVDLKVPRQLVVEKISDMPAKIYTLLTDKNLLWCAVRELYRGFKVYYDELRFVNALKQVI